MLTATTAWGQQPKLKDRPPISILPAEPAWAIAPGPPSADASLSDRHVYVPLQSDEVVAYDRETGEQVWREDIETVWPVAAATEQVFVAASDELHALDIATGAGLWRRSLEDRTVVAPMQVRNGRLYVLVSPDELWAVRVDDGHVLWRHEFGGRASPATMALDDDRVYVVREENRVIAVDVRDGRERWNVTLPGSLSAPASGKDRVFVGSTDNYLSALDTDDGHIVWRKLVGGDVAGASVDRDTVYVASLGNVVWALKRGNGNPLWWHVPDRRPMMGPLAANGVAVHVGISLDTELVAIDGKTGKLAGTYKTNGGIKGPPLVAPRLVPFKVSLWVLTTSGELTGLRPEALTFKEKPATPLAAEPGRPVTREVTPNSLVRP